jgi:transcriptional antiterminator RfaH
MLSRLKGVTMSQLSSDPQSAPMKQPLRNAPDGARENDLWYVVQTQPNREAVARRHLANQGFHPFLPQFVKTISHARKFHKSIAPLFPGYLFVRLDLNRDRWHSVNGTIGVTTLIMAGDRPSPVKRGVVETLVESTALDGELRFQQPLCIGERVRLVSGPFAEQLGVLQHFAGSGRIRVLLEIMGGGITVNLPRGNILKMDSTNEINASGNRSEANQFS